jgi:hypothetical protein
MWSRPWGLKTLITIFGGRSRSTESTQSSRKVCRADMYRKGNHPDVRHGGQSFAKRFQAKDRTRAKYSLVSRAAFWVAGCPGNKHLKSGKARESSQTGRELLWTVFVAILTEINKPAASRESLHRQFPVHLYHMLDLAGGNSCFCSSRCV